MKMFSALTVLILLLNPLHLTVNRFSVAADQSVETSSIAEEIPTVDFCEMVKNPKLYFDKTVRLKATLEQATEAQYLRDERCVLSHDEQIGVGYAAVSEAERDARTKVIREIRSSEYGSRAKVTVIGILRNSSRRSFAWYQYRFDLIRFEDISHVIVPYEGELQGGKTYRARVRGDNRADLSLVIPLRMPEHYAVLIEWTNLSEFPALEDLRKSSREQQIVFSVLSDQMKQMTERRWNRTIQCKIISVG